MVQRATAFIPLPDLSAHEERLCDQFEQALKAGEQPSIEDYLAGARNAADRAEFLRELVLLECEYRSPAEVAPGKADYLARFPEHAGMLAEVFAVGDDAALTLLTLQTRAISTSPIPTARDMLKSSADRTMSDFAEAQPVTDFTKVWPFSELPSRVLRAFETGWQVRPFDAGEVLIRQGDACCDLILVTKGRIEVRVQNQGESMLVVQENAPNVLGEMGLLTRTPCTATVTALTAGQAMHLPADQFRALADEHPMLWLAISQLVARRLGRHDVDVLLGKEVNEYVIRRCVGRGGMAVVYEARQRDATESVALKMMSHRYTFDLEAQARFEREAEICQSLQHPRIARTFGHFLAFGTHFIVMEYCPGETLAERIARTGPLPQNQIRRVAGQLACALSHAHRHQVVHRDLKPSNVMLGEDGNIRLLDFGLAKSPSSGDLTSEHHLLGTPCYMAPEQFEQSEVGPHTDVYAFGLLLWEAITGNRLFAGRNLLQIHCQQRAWTVPPKVIVRPDLDDDLYEALCGSLVFTPRQRTVCLDELAERWRSE